MGNSIAKDFHQVRLGQGSTGGLKVKEMITPEAIILDRPTRILVRRDHQRKSLIFFDLSTMFPVFVTTPYPHRKQGIESVTKDCNGQVLFFVATDPSDKNKKLIYKPTQSIIKSDFSDSSSGGHHHYSHSEDLPFSAEIQLDRSGSAVSAFLSVVVWEGSGPKLLTVYKAVKIQQVKYGVLIGDMSGQVVGKAYIDDHRKQPVIDVAAGADLPSVLGLAAAVLTNFS